MRIGIVTSNDIRHRYFVNAVRKQLDIVAVCYQDTSYDPRDVALKKAAADAAASQMAELGEKAATIVKHHFAERTRQEQIFFGHDAEFLKDSPSCRVFEGNIKTINTPETIAILKQAGVEALIVYGTTMIKPPLLDEYPGRMVNMHLGLSPYYRGNATNFYPLVNNEPEYVGVTIHHIDAGIDSGDIIHHGRADIVAEDMPHTLGCKTIQVGIDLMIQTMRELAAGTLKSVPQWDVPNTHLCKRKDYHPSQVVRLYELIEDGLFPKYAARKHIVAPKVKLVP